MKFGKRYKILVAFVLVLCMAFPLVACNPSGGDEVDGVELDRVTLTLDIGASATLTATVMPLGSKAGVTWKSSNTSVATVNNGTVKAIAAGTASIRASAGGKHTDCIVTVRDSSANGVSVTSVTFNVNALTVAAGSTETISATVLPANATNPTLTWTSSNPQVATVANGVVSGVKKGQAIITGKSHNNIKANCVVTVTGGDAAEETSLYVKKVNSLANRTDFIMGMDASAVPSIEAAHSDTNGNHTYKNFDGEYEDVYKILKDNGITDIRIRIWNDPYQSGHSGDVAYSYGGGNCDLDNAVAISRRCKAVGLGVIIDFHYSDFWADPGKQSVPKAWSGMNETQRAAAIYQFTKSSLEAIRETGVKITMVQVGNETTSAICGASFLKNTATYCNYVSEGSRAVRDVTGTVEAGGAKVAVHLTDPQTNNYLNYAKALHDANVDYDVLGSSYYPFWHGTLTNLANKLSAVHTAYGKDVMVLETSYTFTLEDFDGAGNTPINKFTEPATVQGQANAVRNVIQTIADLGDYGLGVCYWEGTWIAATESDDRGENIKICSQYGCGWASAKAGPASIGGDGYQQDDVTAAGGVVVDNQAFFRSDGTPLKSLQVFKLAKDGQEVDPIADVLYNQEGYYTVDVGEITLPKTVSIVLNDGSCLTVDAYWNVNAEEVAAYIHTVGEYTIEGTTMYGGKCYFTAYVQYPNLLSNGSFENDTGYGEGMNNKIEIKSPWAYQLIAAKTELQLYVMEKDDNAKMGSKSIHFWDSSAVEFKLYQQVDLQKAKDEHGNGTYSFSIDIMGNDAGENQLIYAYAIITYNDGTPAQELHGNTVTLTGWQKWTRTAVDGIELTDNVASITVGIYVKGAGGAWGNVDNAQFYFNPGTSED